MRFKARRIVRFWVSGFERMRKCKRYTSNIRIPVTWMKGRCTESTSPVVLIGHLVLSKLHGQIKDQREVGAKTQPVSKLEAVLRIKKQYWYPSSSKS